MFQARSRLLVLVVVLAGSVAAVGGCDDNGDDNGDEPSARAAFIEEADAICKRALDRNPFLDPNTREEAIRSAGAAVSRLSEEQRGLKRVKAPNELRPDYAAYKAQTSQMQQLAVLGQGAAEAGNQGLYGRANEDYTARAKDRQSIAKQIGFKQCGKQAQA